MLLGDDEFNHLRIILITTILIKFYI